MKTILSLPNEIWKSVEEYPSLEVSNFGRVKSLYRQNPHGGIQVKEKILKGNISKNKGSENAGQGWRVGIHIDGKQEHLIVARLLLTTFVRPPLKGEVARHLDDNKRNNSLDNLAWGTVKDNSEDALRNYCRGSRHPNSKLTENQILEIQFLYVYYSKEYGSPALAKKYGVSAKTICGLIRS